MHFNCEVGPTIQVNSINVSRVTQTRKRTSDGCSIGDKEE